MRSGLCRVLKREVEEARRLIVQELPRIQAFSEDQSPEMRDKIFDEFNTLAIVYQQPSYAFVNQGNATEPHEHDLVAPCPINWPSSCQLRKQAVCKLPQVLNPNRLPTLAATNSRTREQQWTSHLSVAGEA